MGLGESIRLAKGVLRDSFDLTETPHTGPVCTSHGYKPPATRRIDYIFVSDAFRVLRHQGRHRLVKSFMFPLSGQQKSPMTAILSRTNKKLYPRCHLAFTAEAVPFAGY